MNKEMIAKTELLIKTLDELYNLAGKEEDIFEGIIIKESIHDISTATVNLVNKLK